VNAEEHEATAKARQLLVDARIAKSLLMPKTSSMADAPRAAQHKLAALLRQPDFAAVEALVKTARAQIWATLNSLLSRP
jgi:hypothetical protein